MKFVWLSVGLLIATHADAQLGRYKDTVIDGKLYHYVKEPPFSGYYHYVEQMPEAGYDCNKFFKEHLTIPEHYSGEYIGRVVVTFMVNEDGMLSNFKVVKGKEMEQAVLSVMRKMPKWKPGRQNGKPVKAAYALPFKIEL